MERFQILIVEDSAVHRHFCQELLERQGFGVACVETGEAALSFLSHRSMDVVLLDINLPDRDGLALCKSLCRDYQVPVLMMGMYEAPDLHSAGFGATAVIDYLAKPFHSRELCSRLQRMLHNSGVAAVDESSSLGANRRMLVYGPWHLDVREGLLSVDGALPIRLTLGQAELMSLLIDAQGRTVRKAALQQAVARGWGGNSKTIGVLISRLRRSMELMLAGLGDIEAVYGIGYRLKTVTK